MIDIIVDDELEGDYSPPLAIQAAVVEACRVAGFSHDDPELCIRFTSDHEIRALNREWRDKDKVTDVLSFPMQDGPEFLADLPLGDIALAVPFIEEEAKRLALPADAHCLHLIIHATLHLLGYDHIDDADAGRMQQLESQAMAQLGLHNPYADQI